MTAAELASFRATLQAQSAGPSRPDRRLFVHMRARLTVVEGGLSAAPPRPRAMGKVAPSTGEDDARAAATMLLNRLKAVVEAERRGLDARLAAVGRLASET